VIISQCSLFHLALPFKGVFEHAKTARYVGNTILVRLTADDGKEGWGEVLARPYVTGESAESIMDERARARASDVLGIEITHQANLTQWVQEQLPEWTSDLALFGGIELALWSLLEQRSSVDWAVLLGAPRSNPTGRCITIGYDAAVGDMRKRAIDAVLKKATVVKVKVGRDVDEDTKRLCTLSDALKNRLPIRLDGNATMTYEAIDALLAACDALPIQSVEEPMDSADINNAAEQLAQLYSRRQVPIMADESVCSIADANIIVSSGAYQIFNIRVGKHGGLLGSRCIRDIGQAAGLDLVGGSMVGESGVLTQASELLLSRSNALPYVEGLGQNRQFLELDPVEMEQADTKSVSQEELENTQRLVPFRYRARDCQIYLQSELHLAA